MQKKGGRVSCEIKILSHILIRNDHTRLIHVTREKRNATQVIFRYQLRRMTNPWPASRQRVNSSCFAYKTYLFVITCGLLQCPQYVALSTLVKSTSHCHHLFAGMSAYYSSCNSTVLFSPSFFSGRSIKVRPHRTRSAAADCGLCPLRNVTF